MCHIFDVRSSADAHSGFLHALAIVNSAAVNIGVGVCIFSSYSFAWIYA